MSGFPHNEETALPGEPQGLPQRLAQSRGRAHLARCGALLRDGLRVLGAHARDIALPPLCASCREPVSGEGLCPPCWSKLAFISRPYCERLGIPFAYDPGPGFLSMEAIAAPPAYGRARAAVRYDDISGALVKSLKYYDRLDLVPIMGRWLVGAGGDLLTGADAIVPVPLHWRRLWARRFNQSAALAAEVSRISGVAILHDALARRKPTPQQVGLTRAERATNVQGAFAVSAAGKTKIAGKTLVLIDDVLTSGATAEACARALLRAGAGSVDVLVFARVVEAARTPI